MKYSIDMDEGIVNIGNTSRIKKMMKRAKRGEKLTIAFIGGSITEGAGASNAENCYAYQVYDWWKINFPKADFTYLNAGIGGTTSQFGVARVKRDVLSVKPDFIVVEFSVNDSSNVHFLETYEGLVREIYTAEWKPAIVLLYNVRYDTGENAEEYHGKVGKYYQLPCISIKRAIYPEVESGEIIKREITLDDLHPNDVGHGLIADIVNHFLETVMLGNKIEDEEEVPKPFTKNRYQNSERYQNYNTNPCMEKFKKDEEMQLNIADRFKNGWVAKEKGAKIIFELEGNGIAVQYRKTKHKPAQIAKVVVDDDYDKAVLLDANFDEEWGDLLELTTIVEDLEYKKHKIEVEIIETHKEDQKEFYLTSIIMMKNL